MGNRVRDGEMGRLHQLVDGVVCDNDVGGCMDACMIQALSKQALTYGWGEKRGRHDWMNTDQFV